MPYEYAFLREQMSFQIAQNDVMMVATFVRALRTFGESENDSIMRRGLAFLLGRQEKDGLFPETPEEAKQQVQPHKVRCVFQATMVSTIALLTPQHRGSAPCFLDMISTLESDYASLEKEVGLLLIILLCLYNIL